MAAMMAAAAQTPTAVVATESADAEAETAVAATCRWR
tara:strand:- start:586 stop:696 length:111 start_codon:yes stop_codon:yes gene_type:complete